jgi:hypothetical protein
MPPTKRGAGSVRAPAVHWRCHHWRRRSNRPPFGTPLRGLARAGGQDRRHLIWLIVVPSERSAPQRAAMAARAGRLPFPRSRRIWPRRFGHRHIRIHVFPSSRAIGGPDVAEPEPHSHCSGTCCGGFGCPAARRVVPYPQRRDRASVAPFCLDQSGESSGRRHERKFDGERRGRRGAGR